MTAKCVRKKLKRALGKSQIQNHELSPIFCLRCGREVKRVLDQSYVVVHLLGSRRVAITECTCGFITMHTIGDGGLGGQRFLAVGEDGVWKVVPCGCLLVVSETEL